LPKGKGTILGAPAKRGRIKQSSAAILLLRLRENANDVLRFLTDPRVPFDKNLAERELAKNRSTLRH
jgi:transposase